jgi:hypothetical protein
LAFVREQYRRTGTVIYQLVELGDDIAFVFPTPSIGAVIAIASVTREAKAEHPRSRCEIAIDPPIEFRRVMRVCLDKQCVGSQIVEFRDDVV